MNDYEIGPCGVEWPTAGLGLPAEPASLPQRRDTRYPYRCGTCSDPITGDGRLHVWSGRLGLPEKPYDHSPSAT